ncbi:MAG: hypothetical protein LBH43_02115 [Treponema sp.]|jgi:hypothetical protein|nr:hypothetical protein [Treponema sp.]
MKSTRFFGIIAAVLALSFAAATALGAQELKLDGYVNSGLGIKFTDEDSPAGEAKLMIYGVDSERYLGRFRLNGAYTNEAKNAGANFRIQVQGNGTYGGGTMANLPSLAFGYGWVKPIDQITIKAGLVDDSTFRTVDVFLNDSLSEGPGVFTRITPMAGLDFGFGAYAASYQSGSNNNFLDASIPSQIKLADAKYTAYAAYTMDKTFRFMAGFRNENKVLGNSDYSPSELLTELRIMAVDNLTAVVVGQIQNLVTDDDSKDLIMKFYETFAYKMDAITLGLNAAQYMSGADGTDMCIQINPWFSYAMNEGKIVPRLDIVYFMGGEQNSVNYHRRGLRVTAAYNGDNSIVNARPSVKINLDSRNSLEIGDSFYYDLTKDAEKMTNVFYLDFVTRF